MQSANKEYTLAFPGFAPLSPESVYWLLDMEKEALLHAFLNHDTELRTRILDLHHRLIIERNKLAKKMSEVVEDRKMTVSWFRQEIASILRQRALESGETSSSRELERVAVSRETTDNWRDRNLLPPGIDPDSFAGLLLTASLGDKPRLRNALPPFRDPTEPLFHCYALSDPKGKWYPCGIPLKEIAPATLLYSPWRCFSPYWLPTAQGGSIRWAGVKEGSGPSQSPQWTLSASDIIRWNPLFAPRDLALLDIGSYGEQMLHNLANATLLYFSLANNPQRSFQFPPINPIYVSPVSPVFGNTL